MMKMTSYRDRLWILLGEWINDVEMKCVEYDSQLTFVREQFLDYTLLTVHYTNSSKYQFVIRHIDDLEDIILYLELAILWP